MKYFLYIFTYLLLGASCSSPSRPIDYGTELTATDSICLSIDEHTHYESKSIFQFEENGHEYLSFLNEKASYKVHIYDLDTKQVIKTIHLQKEGRNAMPSTNGCFPLSSKHFLITTWNGVFGIINEKGEVENKNSFWKDSVNFHAFDHICRIQPSAKAGLHDQVFHAGFFENQHSHQEQRLKIARMAFALRLVFFGCFFHFEKCVKKLLIRHIFPVDLEPLVDAYKVRGGKKSCLFAACKQHRIQVRADASLSVRARHMDNFDPFLRIPKARKKLPRMFRRMLHRKFRYCFDIINCFCIIHFISPFFSILGLLSNPSIIIIE